MLDEAGDDLNADTFGGSAADVGEYPDRWPTAQQGICHSLLLTSDCILITLLYRQGL